MNRGDICIEAARGADTSKPRPVVIVQDDRVEDTASVTVCPLTTSRLDAPLIRLDIEPGASPGVDQPSQIMIDKMATIPRANVRNRLGRLDDGDRVPLDRALLVFLGLAT